MNTLNLEQRILDYNNLLDKMKLDVSTIKIKSIRDCQIEVDNINRRLVGISEEMIFQRVLVAHKKTRFENATD